MIEQINFSIVIIFAGIILASILVLLCVTPGAFKEYKQKLTTKKRFDKHTSKSESTGLTMYMEELSRCSDIDRIRVLKKGIAKTITEMENESTGPLQSRKSDSVKRWLENFSVDLHIKDLRADGISQQIEFNVRKKVFKLMIVKKK